MSDGRSSFRQAPGVLTRSVGDEVLVALPQGTDVASLAQTSAEVWRVLAGGGRTLREVVDALAEIHPVPPKTIAGDVERLLADLLDRGLVEEIAEEDERRRARG